MRRGSRRVSVRCEAVYTYVVSDRRYKSTNTSVYESDPFGSFQRHLCEKLQQNHRTGKDRCWYDVDNPSRSAMEKVFVPELMIFALAALTIAGSAGLIGSTMAIVRLRRASLIYTSALASDEQNWPAIWLVALVYWLLLSVIAIPISIDTLLQGVVLSVANLLFGVVHICGVALCIWKIRKSECAGILLVPNGLMFRDTFTLRIPSTWSGETRLVMTWLKENEPV